MNPKYEKIGAPAMRVIEECGEILQCVGKGERFGWLGHHPDRPQRTNMDDLESEMFDLISAVSDLRNMVTEKGA